MVLSSIEEGPGRSEFDQFVSRSIDMLGDAKQAFELATETLLTTGRADAIAQDIYEAERRINQANQELREQLVAHPAGNSGTDVRAVIAFTLLVKKIERCGDHAKNILELTENLELSEGGVSLANVPETATLLADRLALAALFDQAADLLSESSPDRGAVADYADRCNAVIADCQAHIEGCLVSDRPGRDVVPLALYYRFHRRIAANLLGVVRAWVEP